MKSQELLGSIIIYAPELSFFKRSSIILSFIAMHPAVYLLSPLQCKNILEPFPNTIGLILYPIAIT